MAEGNVLGDVPKMTSSASAVFWAHQQDLRDGKWHTAFWTLRPIVATQWLRMCGQCVIFTDIPHRACSYGALMATVSAGAWSPSACCSLVHPFVFVIEGTDLVEFQIYSAVIFLFISMCRNTFCMTTYADHANSANILHDHANSAFCPTHKTRCLQWASVSALGILRAST